MTKIIYLERLDNIKKINVNEKMVIELTPKELIKGMTLPREITPELAYFCGVLAGDGSIGHREKKKEYCIKCVGNPADEQE